MDRSNANHSIKCSVDSCTYHCTGADYCALSSIQVGTHEKDPKDKQCTDCQSFEKGR